MGALRNIIRNAVIYPGLTNLAAKILPPSVTIFMLHRIAAPEFGVPGIAPNYLRQCLHHLKANNYRFIAIEDAITRALRGELTKEKWVAFSLDDGFEEQVRLGAEIFGEFDCPSTCFLVTDFVDKKLWPWDYKLMYLAKQSQPQVVNIKVGNAIHRLELGLPNTEAFLLKFARQFAPQQVADAVSAIAKQANIELPEMPPTEMQPTNWSAVRTAEKLGMRFGPHSASHFILARTETETLKDQIERSTQRIRKECTAPANIFCYPSGKADEFDSRAITAARELGLIAALTAEPGYLEQSSLLLHTGYRFALPRLPLPEDIDELKLYVSWAQRARELIAPTPLQQFYSA